MSSTRSDREAERASLWRFRHEKTSSNDRQESRGSIFPVGDWQWEFFPILARHFVDSGTEDFHRQGGFEKSIF
jgi:hypothetical protein